MHAVAKIVGQLYDRGNILFYSSIICVERCDRSRIRRVSRIVRSQRACLEATEVYCRLYNASFWFRAVGGRIYSRAVAIQDSQSSGSLYFIYISCYRQLYISFHLIRISVFYKFISQLNCFHCFILWATTRPQHTANITSWTLRRFVTSLLFCDAPIDRKSNSAMI
jgi:hypothetical protein